MEHERRLRICFGGYDREMVLVAGRTDPSSGECRIVAVGRMNKLHSGNEGEVVILVSDQYQKLGLGGELLRRVIQLLDHADNRANDLDIASSPWNAANG